MTIHEILTLITNNDENAVNALEGILNLPDEQFDEIYPILKEKANEVFETTDIQKQVLNSTNTKNINQEKLESDKKYIVEILDNVKNSDELSDNKKELLLTFLQKSFDLTYDILKNPRERIDVIVKKISPDAVIPKYANPSDAGADIYTIQSQTIKAKETVIVPTGLEVDIPAGYAIFIFPRSGLSYKTKLRIANSVGVIDHLYHKEIGVIIENIGFEPITIKKGERIAQMVILPVPMINFIEGEVEENERGGFGSTGTS